MESCVECVEWNHKVRELYTKETLKLESQFQRKVQLSFDRGPFIKDAIIKGIIGEGFSKSTFVHTEAKREGYKGIF